MEAKRMTLGDLTEFRAKTRPLSELDIDMRHFVLADGDGDDNKMLPASRDLMWQEMLRAVLGVVPEGAEKAPPCNCAISPYHERCDFSGLAGLPPAVRLMDGFFPVRDQSKRGACFAFALVALCEYMLGKSVELSEQSLFHFTKLVTPGKVEKLGDGAYTPDAIRAIEEYGICPLSEWHYNPESWNYVEDPYNEGQGMALQRKLAVAQRYRFRNWRRLSEGSVLQFKQALSAGFPVYTGVTVTTDWDDDDVHRTGCIPTTELLWNVCIAPPPAGLIMKVLEEHGVSPDDDQAAELVPQVAAALVRETLDYIASAVFKCKASYCRPEDEEKDDNGNFFRVVMVMEKARGGHALCLAGYADDPAYPGGGYFIARNSWSDDKWAPESPEMPGYALISYAYIAMLGHEGMTMSEFPKVEGASAPAGAAPGAIRTAPATVGDASSKSAPGHVMGSGSGTASWLGNFFGRQADCSGSLAATPRQMPAASFMSRMSAASSPASPAAGFEQWLASHSSVLDRPTRDADGVLLRPGTPVLMPDPGNDGIIMRNTPQNRERLRPMYDAEAEAADKAAQAAADAAENERRQNEAKAAKERESAIFETVRETVDGMISEGIFSIRQEDVLERMRGFAGCGVKDIRAAMLALQREDRNRYAFCVNRFGGEELRPASALGANRRVES